MNNEPNKPMELTEKELAGIAGGAGDLLTVKVTVKERERVADRGEVDRVGISFVSATDKQFIQATATCYQ